MHKNSGWLCPKCDGAHAPWIETCPSKQNDFSKLTWPAMPQQYFYTNNETPLCNCKPGTFCGNASCPYATKIVC